MEQTNGKTTNGTTMTSGSRLHLTLALLGLVFALVPQASPAQTDEEEEAVLFDEIVQLTQQGRAYDVSFETTGFNTMHRNEMVWLVDPASPGITAIASRPIPGTAKAAEVLGKRGGDVLRQPIALEVASQRSLVLESSGRLVIMRSGWTDSVQVGRGMVSTADVAMGLSSLLYVLWGGEVLVFADGGEPLWSFELEADLRPAVALGISSSGEVVIAGQGEQAVAVYDLDSDGQYRRVRAVSAEALGVASVSGVSISPSMLLPVEGREGWVDADRFIFVADADGGTLLALERKTLKLVGRYDLRGDIPFAAPSRLDISNRGQIAFVDKRSSAAHVLPTRIAVALVEGADFRWRTLEKKSSVHDDHHHGDPPGGAKDSGG